MAIVTLRDVSLSFGDPPLMEQINLQIERGERVALVGRNGCGKSTLMKLLSKMIEPDDGSCDHARGSRVTMLPQEVPWDLNGSVFAIVASGIDQVGPLLTRYMELERALQEDPSLHPELEKTRLKIEELHGWEALTEIESIISKMKLDPTWRMEALSGGQKRRVLLARALALKPDLLLLDEPTNHLDIDSILWLEEFLLRKVPTLLFVTHDRSFLQRMATRIIELDRGNLHSFQCDYHTWLERKEELLETEREQNVKFDKKLAQEEAWLRRGTKARRTRNEGRVRSLLQLRQERNLRRSEVKNVNFSLEKGGRSAKVVIRAKDMGFSYSGGTPLVEGLSTDIVRGDKIGLLGPNGCGKTTLIKLLLGELEPSSGWVSQGHNIAPLYFDQLRQTLEEDRSVRDNIADGKDMVIIGDKQKHVMGYLSDFLFTPEQARSPVHTLSGGEKNRLLLAKLFTRPTNFLIMDEPTNDLDVETLELLEQLLVEYSGTLIVVSHDRTFINNVVTSTLVFEGDGRVGEYAGGYDDWLSQRQEQAPERAKKKEKKEKKPRPDQKPAVKKLTFKEKRELEALPGTIEELEAKKESLLALLSDPSFYKEAGEKVAQTNQELESIDKELDQAYERWTELEERKPQ